MTLAEQIKQLMELDAKRTQGEWQLNVFLSGTVSVVMRTWPPTNHDNGSGIGYGYMAAMVDAYDIGNQNETSIHHERYYNGKFIEQSANHAASIIRQLVDIVAQQHEAIQRDLKERHDDEDYGAEEFLLAAAALSAPIVNMKRGG